MATQNQPYRPTDGNGRRNAREIEHDIERTRGEMDETLDELTERLRPRHLLDEAFDYLRASTGDTFSKEELAHRAKDFGAAAVCQIRRHPVPSALIGAGILWMLFESGEEDRDIHAQWDEIPEYSGSFVDARTGEPYDLESYGAGWKQEVPAWRQGYDWSKSDVDEESWKQRAQESLAHIRTTLSDSGKSAAEKMREVSRRITGLAGHKQSEMHARWDNLREHSGSFVDARTGEPYDENYGREWQALMACDYCATGDWSAEDQETWSEKAQHALEEMQATLSDTGRGAKEQVQALAAKVGDFVGGTRGMSAGFARSAGRRAARMRRGVGRGARYVGRQARRGGAEAGRQLSQGYAYSRDAVSEVMDDYPLAAGAACLGLGLLLGLALPHTRYEDRMMGEASDDVKRRAEATGREVAERARHVAEATAAAAMDEAEEQGIAPAQLAEKAQRAADKAASRVQEKTGAGVHSMAEKAERVAERAAETAKQETRHEAQEMTGRHTSPESRPSI